MLTASMRRKTVLLPLLLLVTVSVTPWASAAPSPQPEGLRVVQSIEPVALDIFSHILSFFHSGGSKEGCDIDPSGRCANGPSQSASRLHTKAGCDIDPSGRCIP